LFLQTLVFFNIAQNGYFSGIENNKFILTSEIGLTAFAATYFCDMLIRFLHVQF